MVSKSLFLEGGSLDILRFPPIQENHILIIKMQWPNSSKG